jgi:hypothetical protein
VHCEESNSDISSSNQESVVHSEMSQIDYFTKKKIPRVAPSDHPDLEIPKALKHQEIEE